MIFLPSWILTTFVFFLSVVFVGYGSEKTQITEYFPPATFGNGDLGHDAFMALQYSKFLRAFKEDALCNSQTNVETYRVMMLPTFNSPLMVCIKIQYDGTAAVHAKRLNGKGGYDPGEIDFERSGTLPSKKIELLRSGIAKTNFWQLPTEIERKLLDGTDWVFEGVRDGRYHVVTRAVEDENGPFCRFCLWILKLGGLDEDDAYIRRTKP